MTVEERVARLEQRADDRDVLLTRMEAKLDQLLAALYMGKGSKLAWAKIGGMALTILAATGWLYDHFVQPLIGKH